MIRTVEIDNLVLEVEYNYYPGDEPKHYYNDLSGYPGFPGYVEIERVYWKGMDITEVYENLRGLEHLEDELENQK